MKRIFALFLALVLLLGALCACAESRAVWLKYKDTTIDDAAYRFWLAEIKTLS